MLATLSDITTDLLNIFPGYDISVGVLRLDKVDPLISGNKWFKLRYYLEDAQHLGMKRFVTFGGAWSNHLLAVAATAKLGQMSSRGIIRGERPAVLSATLEQCASFGMELEFVSRDEYRDKETLLSAADEYLIPEGGYGEKGALGAGTIFDCTDFAFTHCCCAAGTGTMMAGLINRMESSQQLTGISVLKNNPSLQSSVSALLTADRANNWEIMGNYHFGGYAKHTPALISFMNSFYQSTGIPTDFVYTGKLMYAVTDLVKQGHFPAGSRLLVIHSGGLQGNRSMEKGKLMF